MSYDVAYQEWLEARHNGNYGQADAIRDRFEYEHGLTIFAEGAMPIEDVTVRRMTLSKWYAKFQPGNTKLLQAIQGNDGMYHSPLMAFGAEAV